MQRRVQVPRLSVALAVLLDLAICASSSYLWGVYVLGCGNFPLRVPKLEVKIAFNATGLYLTSFPFYGTETCELPAELTEVRRTPPEPDISLRTPPIFFPGLVCGETPENTYYWEVFIRRPEVDYFPGDPYSSCHGSVRHAKGRRYILILNQENRQSCLCNELSSKKRSNPPKSSSEPKNVDQYHSLRNVLIGAAGAIIAALFLAVVPWVLNEYGLCCWNPMPEESEGEDSTEDADTEESRVEATNQCTSSSV